MSKLNENDSKSGLPDIESYVNEELKKLANKFLEGYCVQGSILKDKEDKYLEIGTIQMFNVMKELITELEGFKNGISRYRFKR